MESSADPIEVVFRQDRAYGPDTVDIDLWLSSLIWPLTLQSGNDLTVLPDRAAIVTELHRITKIARAEGVRRLRTRVLSHLQPADDTAIVASMRDRLGAGGELLGTSSMTWTLSLFDGGWKIQHLYFEESHYGLPPGGSTLGNRKG